MEKGPSQSTLDNREIKADQLSPEPKLSEHDQEITEVLATPGVGTPDGQEGRQSADDPRDYAEILESKENSNQRQQKKSSILVIGGGTTKEGPTTATVVSNVRGRSILGGTDNRVTVATGGDNNLTTSDKSTVRISGTLNVINGKGS